MPLLYDTDTFSALDLTGAGAVVFTHTMAATGRIGVSLVMTGFNGQAATITMKIATLDGSDNVYGSVVETTAKVTGDTRLRFEAERAILIPSGYKVQVTVGSRIK